MAEYLVAISVFNLIVLAALVLLLRQMLGIECLSFPRPALLIPKLPSRPTKASATGAVPREWLPRLQSLDVVPRSSIEAAMHIVFLDAAAYREEVARLENAVRFSTGTIAELRDIIACLNKTTSAWCGKLCQADALLADAANLPNLAGAAARLQRGVAESAEQVNVQLTVDDIEFETARGAAITELIRRIDAAGRVRDAAVDLVREFTVSQAERWTTPPRWLAAAGKWQFLLAEQVWEDDCPFSVMTVVQVDGVADLTSQVGTAAARRALDIVREHFVSRLQHPGAAESVYEWREGRLLALLRGRDVGAAGALASEFQQQVGTTKFMFADREYHLQARVVVASLQPGPTLDAERHRIEAALPTREDDCPVTVLDGGEVRPLRRAGDESSAETLVESIAL